VSSLSRLKPIWRDPDPQQAWNAAQQAWREHGVVLLIPDQVEKRFGWVAARDAKNLGELCFGMRGKK
jgi:hypothetical protein